MLTAPEGGRRNCSSVLEAVGSYSIVLAAEESKLENGRVVKL